MSEYNSSNIEKAAVSKLDFILARSHLLQPLLYSNDKTPSWDGEVIVYGRKRHRKDDFLGKVPVQIKGTAKKLISNNASFNCQVSDLRNYYLEGGCIFFLISVDMSSDDCTIYYSSLHVIDLKKTLDKAKHQKSISIKLEKFPQNDYKEIESIFFSFINESRKQKSFINKDLPSLESVLQSQSNVESLSFDVFGVGLNEDNIGTFITSGNREFYLYAKVKDFDVEIPVDTIKPIMYASSFPETVSVKEKKYYSSYESIYKNGKSFIRIGKAISIFSDKDNNVLNIEFKPSGYLSEIIRDITFIIDMIERKEISLGNVQIILDSNQDIDLTILKEDLEHYQNLQRVLSLLGINGDLQCDNLSNGDVANIRLLLDVFLYNKRIPFKEEREPMTYGPMVIANLSIWLWGSKCEDEKYQIENFFNPRMFTIYAPDDKKRSNPILASHYLLLNKNAFIHASNMNTKSIIDEINLMKHHPLLNQLVNLMMLKILLAYDEQEIKNGQFLELAMKICDWLSLDGNEKGSPALRLNQLQIEKRQRNLTVQEIIELGSYTDKKYSPDIRCGAFLLMGYPGDAEKCFNEMSKEEQNNFVQYPINHFRELTQGGK